MHLNTSIHVTANIIVSGALYKLYCIHSPGIGTGALITVYVARVYVLGENIWLLIAYVFMCT